jgi:hypothetical protein
LADGDAHEDDVEEDGDADADDDDPTVQSAIRDAEEEERHREFKEALVEEVECDA